MPLSVFELCCFPIIALTLASLAWVRRRSGQRLSVLFTEYGVLAVAGYLGEETCISWYRFYAYAEGWHAKLDHVPALIVLIWPLFILSGRDMGALFFPRAPAWLSTSLMVLFDASLVEVIAVRAGYWSWAEPGHLGVPFIGMLGWSFFAVGAAYGLGRGMREHSWKAALLTIASAFASTHILIFGAWWCFFRFVARGDMRLLGFVPLTALGLMGLYLLVRSSRSPDSAATMLAPEERAGALMRVVFPRLAATALFVVIAARTVHSLRDPLLAHIVLVGATYSVASLFYSYVRVERKAGAIPEVST